MNGKLLKTMLWRRSEPLGFDSCAFRFHGGSVHLAGVALFTFRRQPCRLDYEVETDSGGRTRTARVAGSVGTRPIDIAIRRDRSGRWFVGRKAVAAVAGCADIDLSFSPATNTLPIRRSSMAVGEAVRVRSAWLRFPDLTVQLLDQTYHRVDRRRYRYRTSAGFRAVLEVDGSGIVTRYGGLWRAWSGVKVL